MKNTRTLPQILTVLAAGALLAAPLARGEDRSGQKEESWKSSLISPVANPLFFEDPNITSEVRPIFMQHYLPKTFRFSGGRVPLGGDVRVYAVQLRYALTDRLALIATKDGFIEFRPKNTLSHNYGWADLAAGLKYAVVDDEENQLLVTPGFTVTLPTGNQDVLQGSGAGEWNVFTSAAKGWDKFHLLGNLGFRIPNNFSQQTAQAHYSLQADYACHRFFTPFVALNGYTMLSNGKDKLLGAVPLHTEMSDLINFGSTEVSGRTQLTAGGGFRSHLCKRLDVGFAYEAGITDPKGIFASRLTTDLIWRF